MARKTKSKNGRTTGSWGWRSIISSLLAIFGVLFLIGYLNIHWVQRQLLTTDNWVKMVSTIPKDPQVSAALANYSVDKLLTGLELESRISAALPPQLSFVAPSLAERVDNRATEVATKFISSDQFQGFWTATNRIAHQKLMESARNDSASQASESKPTFSLRLGQLLQDIKARFGIGSTTLFDDRVSAQPPTDELSLGVELKTRLADFKRMVSVADFLNSVLWLAALAALLGALVLARAKVRLAMIVLTAISVLCLLQLIGVRVLRPEVLNQIENMSYKPAAGVVYDHLLASLTRGATTLFVVSTGLFALLLATQLKIVKQNSFIKKVVTNFYQTTVYQWLCSVRVGMYEYRWPIIGTGIFTVLVYTAFVPDFGWVGLIQIALVASIIVSLVHLLALQQTAGSRRRTKV